MKRKILFFLYRLAGGGAERTTINIINNLDKDKFDVVLVLGTSNNNDYGDLLEPNVRVKILNSKKLRYSIFKLRRIIRKEKPDLLFSTINENNILLLLAKFVALYRKPVIVREASHRTESGNVSVINRIITSILYNRLSSSIVALSEGVKGDLVDNFKISKDKIKVIYNPIEIDKIKKMSVERVTDFKQEDDEKVIIAVGRLTEAKDYRTLLRAFKIVSENVKSKLIILGKGKLEEELKNLCDHFGVSEKVLFLGFKSNPYKYMKTSDLFVLSSRWEGFGHVIVEAMATGIPVISTDCKSGPKEIINDKYGVLVPVSDFKKLSSEIIKMLNNDDKRNRLSKLGYERSKKFHVKKIIKEYEKLFINEIND